MAEWLGTGLQNPPRRFDSARHLFLMIRWLLISACCLLFACKEKDFVAEDRCCTEVRVLHLGPLTPDLKIEADYFNTRTTVTDSLAYGQTFPEFEYLKLDASIEPDQQGWSRYRFQASPLRESQSSYKLSQHFSFEPNMPYTLAIGDTGLAPVWIQLIDRAPPVGAADTSSIYIRLVNLSALNGLTLAIQDRNTEPAPKLSASPWLRVSAGLRRLQLLDPSLNVVWEDERPRLLEPQRVYQAYFNSDTLLLVSDRFR